MGIIKERVQPLDNKMALMGRDAQAAGLKIIYDEENLRTFTPGRVYVSPEVSMKSAYYLAHQIQRALMHKQGAVNFERWGIDATYRIHIEKLISLSAAKLLMKYEISLNELKASIADFFEVEE